MMNRPRFWENTTGVVRIVYFIAFWVNYVQFTTPGCIPHKHWKRIKYNYTKWMYEEIYGKVHAYNGWMYNVRYCLSSK